MMTMTNAISISCLPTSKTTLLRSISLQWCLVDMTLNTIIFISNEMQLFDDHQASYKPDIIVVYILRITTAALSSINQLSSLFCMNTSLFESRTLHLLLVTLSVITPARARRAPLHNPWGAETWPAFRGLRSWSPPGDTCKKTQPNIQTQQEPG